MSKSITAPPTSPIPTEAIIKQEPCAQLFKEQADYDNWLQALLFDAKVAQTDLAAAQAKSSKADTAKTADEASLATHKAAAKQAQNEFDVAEGFLHSSAANDSNNFQNFLREAQAAAQRLATANLEISNDQQDIKADQDNKAQAESDKLDANYRLTVSIPAALASCTAILPIYASEIQRRCKDQVQPGTTVNDFGTVSSTTNSVNNNNSGGSTTPTLTGTVNQNPAIAAGNNNAVLASTTVPFLDGGVVSADPGTPSNNVTGFGTTATQTIPAVPDVGNITLSPGGFAPPGGFANGFFSGDFGSNFTTGGLTTNAYGLPFSINGQVLPPNLLSQVNSSPAQIGGQFDFGSPFTTFSSDSPTFSAIGGIDVTGGGGNDNSFNIDTSLGDTSE